MTADYGNHGDWSTLHTILHSMCQVISLVVIYFACKVYVNVRLKLYEHKIFWRAGLQPYNICHKKESLESVTLKDWFKKL